MNEDENPWIEWNGGTCPVEPNELVEVLIDGRPSFRRSAWATVWQHDLGYPKVTSYRVVKP